MSEDNGSREANTNSGLHVAFVQNVQWIGSKFLYKRQPLHVLNHTCIASGPQSGV